LTCPTTTYPKPPPLAALYREMNENSGSGKGLLICKILQIHPIKSPFPEPKVRAIAL